MSNYNDTEILRREFLKSDSKLLILSITKRCNLKCVYCRGNGDWYDVLSKDSKEIDYSRDNWEQLANFCKDNNIMEVLLTGGEPLAYPHMEELLHFLKANRIRFSIHTNGTDKRWESIIGLLNELELKPNIAMSVELFDALQRDLRGSELPYGVIDLLLSNGFNIELKVTLHMKLLPYVDFLQDTITYWKNKGIKSIRFQPVEPVGDTFPDELKVGRDFLPVLDRLMAFKQDDHPLQHFIRNSLASLDTIRSLIIHGRVDHSVPNECRISEKIAFINPDNQVLNCRSLWGRQEVPCNSETFNYVCCGYKS